MGHDILKSDKHVCLGWFMYIVETLHINQIKVKWRIAEEHSVVGDSILNYVHKFIKRPYVP